MNAAIHATNTTRITISHRPETIGAGDRVIMLKDGRIQPDETSSGEDSPAYMFARIKKALEVPVRET